MPHNHSSSKQSRLGVRANPLGTSTPSQKPLLRLLRAAGRWLQGAAWSWAWVAFSEVRSTAGVPGCPRRARREIWSLSGSPCPANNLCSCSASSPEMRGSCCGEERSCGLWGREVPGGLLPAPAACSVQAAAPCWLSCHPLTVYVSPTASSCVTHCWLCHPLLAPSPAADQGSHLSPCRHGCYKPRKLFKVFIFIQQTQSCRNRLQTGAHTSKVPELGWGEGPQHSPAPRHCYHQDEHQRCAGSRVQGCERRAGGLKHEGQED